MWPQTRLKNPPRRPVLGSAPGWAATPTTPRTITATKWSTAPLTSPLMMTRTTTSTAMAPTPGTTSSAVKRQPAQSTKRSTSFRSAARRIAKATGQDPNHSDHLIKVPAGAPQPEDIYGYQALRWIFGSEQAARVSAWAAAQYHREQDALAGDYPALRPRPHDGPALPIKDRHLYTSSDRSAEEEYPEDRSPAELGRDPPDSKEKPWWADLIKEGRRARATATRPPAIPGVHSAYDCNTATPPTRGRPGPSHPHARRKGFAQLFPKRVPPPQARTPAISRQGLTVSQQDSTLGTRPS